MVERASGRATQDVQVVRVNGRACEFELSEAEWARIKPLLPPQRPAKGRPAQDHRAIVSGILWVERTGGPWRQMPSQYGVWSTVASRYHRWKKSGVWQRIQAALREDEWLRS